MLREIGEHARNGDSFAFETTLAGRNYARMVPQWQTAGYEVKLIFLSLPTADLAVARVAARVAQGGHSVPEDVVRRRFRSGLENFKVVYMPLVTSWAFYDSSYPTPRLLRSGDNT